MGPAGLEPHAETSGNTHTSRKRGTESGTLGPGSVTPTPALTLHPALIPGAASVDDPGAVEDREGVGDREKAIGRLVALLPRLSVLSISRIAMWLEKELDGPTFRLATERCSTRTQDQEADDE